MINLFTKKKHVDIDKELAEIIDVLEESKDDIDRLLSLAKEMEKYRKRDHHVKKKNLPDIGLGFNTEQEVKIWDKF